MAVVLARQVADCLCPTGGTEHRVTETLSGIHLCKGTINTSTVNNERKAITRQRDESSSAVAGGQCTVKDGVSASIAGTANTRTSAWDDKLADNACKEHNERTDFSGGYFAAEDCRRSQEAPVGCQCESPGLCGTNILPNPKRGSHATRKFLRSKRLEINKVSTSLFSNSL